MPRSRAVAFSRASTWAGDGFRPMTPEAIERRLKQTARDLGAPGPDEHYGAGLIDAGRATDPAIPVT